MKNLILPILLGLITLGCSKSDNPAPAPVQHSAKQLLLGSWTLTSDKLTIIDNQTGVTNTYAQNLSGITTKDVFTEQGQYSRTISNSGSNYAFPGTYIATDTTFTVTGNSSSAQFFSTPVRTATKLVTVHREQSGTTRTVAVQEFTR